MNQQGINLEDAYAFEAWQVGPDAIAVTFRTVDGDITLPAMTIEESDKWVEAWYKVHPNTKHGGAIERSHTE